MFIGLSFFSGVFPTRPGCFSYVTPAGAGIGFSPLAPDGKTSYMPEAPVRTGLFKPFDIQQDLLLKLAFDFKILFNIFAYAVDFGFA